MCFQSGFEGGGRRAEDGERRNPSSTIFGQTVESAAPKVTPNDNLDPQGIESIETDNAPFWKVVSSTAVWWTAKFLFQYSLYSGEELFFSVRRSVFAIVSAYAD
uniref:Uncharacterized protein n=1 Tax=Nelumbo nucifera TaxID=4432 RepID=A0A822ZZB5_NELNU|nr:TPA_asm: hypothetical protein HUJ06_018386 [Nelumbo nucifera]